MDLTILIGIATALLAILITLFFLQKKKTRTDDDRKLQQQQQRGVPQRAQEAVPRRAQIVRNQRNRLRQNAAPAAARPAAALDNALNDSDTENEQGEIPQGQVLDEKMGAKKRAKMEQKEQKRLMREQELKMREERKAKEAKEEEVRKKQEVLEAEEERKKAEAERLAREERERREHEEYLKMKAAFSVEEEGFEEDEKENMLADFIKYIKDNKVVVLEDLATEFNLKTQQAIERIQELQANSTITGVVDDCGKFIYISEEELLSVAKFIKQRGRVSIAELAECSNNLINVTPAATNESE